MKKTLISIISMICVLAAVYYLLEGRLNYLDRSFNTTFRKTRYTVIEHTHYPGRDFAHKWIIKLNGSNPGEMFDTDNYEDGYSYLAKQYISHIDSTEFPENVKTRVFDHKNTRLADKVIIVYNPETSYYTVYYITI